MQATVHRFDPITRTGSVVTDAGFIVPFTAEAFGTANLRHLRPGQRLSVEVSPEGRAVTAMRLGTVGRVTPRVSRP